MKNKIGITNSIFPQRFTILISSFISSHVSHLHFQPTLITLITDTRSLTFVRKSHFYYQIPVSYIGGKGLDISLGLVPPRLHQSLAITTRKPLQKLRRLRGIGSNHTHFYLFPCFWCQFGVSQMTFHTERSSYVFSISL